MGILEKFITREELAKEFGVSEKSIYRWTKKYGLPSAEFGNTVLYDKESVVSFIYSRIRQSGAANV